MGINIFYLKILKFFYFKLLGRLRENNLMQEKVNTIVAPSSSIATSEILKNQFNNS